VLVKEDIELIEVVEHCVRAITSIPTQDHGLIYMYIETNGSCYIYIRLWASGLLHSQQITIAVPRDKQSGRNEEESDEDEVNYREVSILEPKVDKDAD